MILQKKLFSLGVWIFIGTQSWAAHVPAPNVQLHLVKERVTTLEQSLLDGFHSAADSRVQLKKIKQLLNLQKLEKKLGEQRLQELEKTVKELESRRALLSQTLSAQQQRIHGFLVAIESSSRDQAAQKSRSLADWAKHDQVEAPRRRTLSKLVDQGLKEVQLLKADLADDAQLETKILEEREQLAYLFQDLKEQASILELNRNLQLDFLKREKKQRVSQLENYRKLKKAEAHVEDLIGGFSAKKELQTAEFAQLKGKLNYPVAGAKVVGNFGRAFDAQSGLFVFKKGIDLETTQRAPVRAVAGGRVAFSGSLPGYGQVVILDHGGHFYSLCGRLGRVDGHVNDLVRAGEVIGRTGEDRGSLYFEIRSKNVAVNPLQWLFN